MPRYGKGTKMYGPGTAAGKKAFVTATRQLARVAAGGKARGRPVRVSKGLVSAIKSVVGRQEETKYSAEVDQNNTAVLQGVTTPGELYKMVPQVSQGAADNNRIGDSITPKSTQLQLTFNYIPSDAKAVDQIINVLVLRVKGVGTAAALTQVPAGTLLKVGNGTNTDPNDPDQTKMIQVINRMPVNTDQFTVLKRYRFRMAKGIGFINSIGIPVAPDVGQIANTPTVKQITFSWKPPKLKYQGPPSTMPTNHYPVWCAWATNSDGSANQQLVHVTSRLQMFYKDS